MATSKNGKVVSTLDAVNLDLAKSLSASLNLGAELAWYESAVKMLKGEKISVRGLKATIEEAEKIGTAPTVRTSSAQYFLASAEVRALSGGKDQSLKTVLNTTIQAKRAFKKEFADKVKAAKSFAEFANSIPAQGERPEAGRKAKDMNALMTAFIEGMGDLENILPTDIKIAADFFKKVTAIQTAIRANHPTSAKKSA